MKLEYKDKLIGKSIFKLKYEKKRKKLADKKLKGSSNNKKEMYSFTVTIDGKNMGSKLPEYPIKLNMDKEKFIESLQRYIDGSEPVLENGDKNFGLEICKRVLKKMEDTEQ